MTHKANCVPFTSQTGAANIFGVKTYFDKIYATKCMKMKEIALRDEGIHSTHSPGSTNALLGITRHLTIKLANLKLGQDILLIIVDNLHCNFFRPVV